MSTPATARIRELWPLVLVLRREGVSWRLMPRQMHDHYGVQLVTHVCYILVAHEMGDINDGSPPLMNRQKR